MARRAASRRWKALRNRVEGLAASRRNTDVIARHVARLELAASDAPERPALRSRPCRQDEFDAPTREWLERLYGWVHLARSHWEHAVIARALDAASVVGPGSRGLGFGVGREPIVAWAAGRGSEVLATDLDPADRRAPAWADRGQFGGAREELQRPDLCPPEEFAERVRRRSVDMNAVPADLVGFDFTWSACALEHLGSLDAGARFVERAMSCLRSGGLAVHTTELNVSDPEQTVEEGATVAYRQSDLETLARRLEEQGHRVAPLDFRAGDGLLDELEPVLPYGWEHHVRARLGPILTTSFALVVEAR